jgi:SET domain
MILESKSEWKAFRQWIKGNGFPRTHLCLANFQETGRGLMAVKDVTGGIVRIPDSMLITPLKSQLLFSGVDICGVSEQCQLALFLCHHKIHHTSWRAYIDILPKTFTIACYIPDTLLELLPPEIVQRATAQDVKWRSEYSKVKALFKSYPCIPQESLFKWAYFCVHTRCISCNDPTDASGGILVAPFLDCLNHSNSVTISAGKTKDGYVISSPNEFKKGQQVFINYGPHDNCFLMAEYGFISNDDNPYNHVVLDDIVKDLFEPYKDKLEMHGMYGDYTIAKGDIGYRIINAILFCRCKTKEDTELWERIQKGDPAKFPAEVERKVYKTLGIVCERKRAMYINNLTKLRATDADPYLKQCCQSIFQDGIEIIDWAISALQTNPEYI